MARAAIFDVDGTLVDTVDLHARAWVEAFAHFGLHPSFEAVRSQIGKGGDQLMPVFASKAFIETQGKALEDFRGELFQRDYMPKARAFPKVRALFERLRADGVAIAVGSSCKGEELKRYTDLAHVTDLIDVAATSDDADKSKPSPEIFEAAVRKLQPIPPDGIVVVGDSPFDAKAAQRAGLRAIGLRCGGFPEERLREAGFLELYDDPAALLARYDESLIARA